jgi:hypothetical protein
MTRMLVSSAAGPNGDGYGAVLEFDARGVIEKPFSDDPRVVDPRGMSADLSSGLVYVNSGDDRVVALDSNGGVVLDSGRINGLDPGGGYFGPDGRYYLTLRKHKNVLALPASLAPPGSSVLHDDVVPFPRGFGFAHDGGFYLASGIGPSGEGDNTIVAFNELGKVDNARLVDDPELSPLDLIVAPSGNVVVSSEWPFGEPGAATTIREYDPCTGKLVRVLAPDLSVGFAKPRGLRLLGEDRLFWVGREHVVGFDFTSGRFLGVVAELERLNGQAVVFLPDRSAGH